MHAAVFRGGPLTWETSNWSAGCGAKKKFKCLWSHDESSPILTCVLVLHPHDDFSSVCRYVMVMIMKMLMVM